MTRRPSRPPDAPKPAGMPVLPLCPQAPPKESQSSQAEPPPLDAGQPDTADPWWRPTRRQASGWLTSCLFHATVLIALALIAQAPGPGRSVPTELTAYASIPVPSPSPLDEDDWKVDLAGSERPGNSCLLYTSPSPRDA